MFEFIVGGEVIGMNRPHRRRFLTGALRESQPNRVWQVDVEVDDQESPPVAVTERKAVQARQVL